MFCQGFGALFDVLRGNLSDPHSITRSQDDVGLMGYVVGLEMSVSPGYAVDVGVPGFCVPGCGVCDGGWR